MAVSVLATTHVNVNCSDLARSLGFYRDLVGLEPLSHTRPLPQEGAGFGLPGEVQWDAWLLHDDRGVAGPAIDLLAWRQPPPTGRPPAVAHQLGLFRICLSHPDVDALHARLDGLGVRTLGPPGSAPLDEARSLSVRFFAALDPDGTCVEFLERPGATRLLHVNANCSDLERSSTFYQRVLGLAPLLRVAPEAFDARPLGLGARTRFRADFLALPDRPDLVIDLLEWQDPKPVGQPAAAANQLGPFRVAWLVEDAGDACAELDRLGVTHSGPCRLDMGKELPIDGLRAIFFRDPDGVCLELIERPRVRS